MKAKKPYKRKAGEFEIRVLRDGRVVMVAPDKRMLEVAQQIENEAQTKELHHEGHEEQKII